MKEITLIALDKPMQETDKYGFKKMFSRINELFRCPNDNQFLVYKDESHETLECPDCGFTKPLPEEFKR